MEGIGAYLAMGGYAVYLWPAFAVTFGLMAALALWTWRRLKASERVLAALEADAAAQADGGGAERGEA